MNPGIVNIVEVGIRRNADISKISNAMSNAGYSASDIAAAESYYKEAKKKSLSIARSQSQSQQQEAGASPSTLGRTPSSSALGPVKVEEEEVRIPLRPKTPQFNPFEEQQEKAKVDFERGDAAESFMEAIVANSKANTPQSNKALRDSYSAYRQYRPELPVDSSGDFSSLQKVLEQDIANNTQETLATATQKARQKDIDKTEDGDERNFIERSFPGRLLEGALGGIALTGNFVFKYLGDFAKSVTGEEYPEFDNFINESRANSLAAVRQFSSYLKDGIINNGLAPVEDLYSVDEKGEIQEKGVWDNVKDGNLGSALALTGVGIVENIAPLAVTLAMRNPSAGAAVRSALITRGVAPSIAKYAGNVTALSPGVYATSLGNAWGSVADDPDFTDAEKFVYALASPAIETLTEGFDVGEYNAIDSLYKYLTKGGTQSAKQSFTPILKDIGGGVFDFLKAGGIGGLEEYAAGGLQQAMARMLADKPFDHDELMDAFFIGAGMEGGINLLSKSPNFIGRIGNLTQTIKITDEIAKIEDALTDPSISDAERMILTNRAIAAKDEVRRAKDNAAIFFGQYTPEDLQETMTLNADIVRQVQSMPTFKTDEAKSAAIQSVKDSVARLQQIETKYDSQKKQQVPGAVQAGAQPGGVPVEAQGTAAAAPGGVLQDVSQTQQEQVAQQRTENANAFNVRPRLKKIRVTSQNAPGAYRMIMDSLSNYTDEFLAQNNTSREAVERGVKSLFDVISSLGTKGRSVEVDVMGSIQEANKMFDFKISEQDGKYNVSSKISGYGGQFDSKEAADRYVNSVKYRGVNMMADGKNVKINVLLPAMLDNTGYHEALHSLEVLDDKSASRLVKSLLGALKKTPRVNDRIMRFLGTYDKAGDALTNSEFLAELGSMISSGEISLEIGDSALKNLIDGFSNFFKNLFGLNKADTPPTAEQLASTLKSIAEKLGRGEAQQEYILESAERIREGAVERAKVRFQGFERWKGDNEYVYGKDVQDVKSGTPIVAKGYHGTTNEFYEFDSSVKGNIEGYLGKVNYFTTDYQDAAIHYQSEGPDLKNRIESRAEQIENTLNDDYVDDNDNVDIDRVVSDYRLNEDDIFKLQDIFNGDLSEVKPSEISYFLSEKELKGGEDRVIEVYVKLNNPLVLGGNPVYYNSYGSDTKEYADMYEMYAEEVADDNGVSIEEAKDEYDYEIRDRIMESPKFGNKILNAFTSALDKNGYGFMSDRYSEPLENYLYDEDVNLNQLDNDLRRNNSLFFENENGELAFSQVLSDFYKNLGFDGIILANPSQTFRGMNISPSTSHIHVFDEYANQIKLADGSNVTFGETKDIRFQRIFADVIDGLYSPLENNILQSKQDKMPAKQWLDKFARTDEAYWTGLQDWLGTKQGSVSKQEIMDWLKDNRVEIRERVRGDIDINKAQQELDELKEKKEKALQKAKPYTDKGEDAPQSIIEEVTDIENQIQELEKWAIRESNTKFSQYQLEGEKENYKELLVTLPQKLSIPDGKYIVYTDKGAREKREYIKGFETEKEAFNWIKENEDKYPYTIDFETRKVISEIESGNVFKSTHFPEKNILVHLRMNTRTDVDGNKVLFLEEVQSDWGQKGRKQGFEGDKAIELFNQFKYEVLDVDGKKLHTFLSSDGETVISSSEKFESAKKTAEDIARRNAEFLYTREVPKAPFVTDTNAWTKLGLKMALREAVRQNADKLAWTTGEQQNDRYDLSKQIDYINVIDKKLLPNERYVDISLKDTMINVTVDKKTGVITSQLGSTVMGDFKGKGLDELIGKDLADKVMLSENGAKLEGEGLKVGGKGMKGFYDKIVPDAAKAVVRELTGEKIETGEAMIPEGKGIMGEPTVEELEKAKELALKDNDKSSANFLQQQIDRINKGQEYSYALFNSNEPASEYFDKVRQPSVYIQQSIDITPELKAAVQRGVPKFQAVETITLNNGKKIKPTVIEGNTIFYHGSSKKREGRLRPNNAIQWGKAVYFSPSKQDVVYEFGDKNITEVRLNLSKPVYTNTQDFYKVASKAIEIYTEDQRKKGSEVESYGLDDIEDGYYFGEAASQLGYDAIIDINPNNYGVEIAVINEGAIIYPEDIKSISQPKFQAPALSSVEATTKALEEVSVDSLNKAKSNFIIAKAEEISKKLEYLNCESFCYRLVNNRLFKKVFDKVDFNIKFGGKTEKVVSELQKILNVGDIIAFGGKNNAMHYAIYLGGDSVYEVEEWGEKPRKYSLSKNIDYYEGLNNIYRDNELNNEISEAYHKAKKDGSNPELVRAVEELLGGKPKFQAPTNNELDRAYERSNKMLKEMNKKGVINRVITALADRQAPLKKAIMKAGLKDARNLLVTQAGAGSRAAVFVAERFKDIYNGLNPQQIEYLDKIILARRIIQIDTEYENKNEVATTIKDINRLSKGDLYTFVQNGKPITKAKASKLIQSGGKVLAERKKIKHPGDITKEVAERDLNQYRQALGANFNTLMQRSDAYFDAYKELLGMMRSGGLITQETYDNLSDLLYQPRLFLQQIIKFDEGSSVIDLQDLGLNAAQIKSLSLGSNAEILTNSMMILAISSKSVYSRLARNKTYASLSEAAKDPNNSSWIQEARRIGPKSFSQPPRGFEPVAYYVDGVRNQFYLREDFSSQLYDATRHLINPNIAKNIRILSGSAILKSFATQVNPLFALKNFPRDVLHVAMFTNIYGNNLYSSIFKISRDAFKGMHDKMSKSTDFKEWLEYGGGMDFLSTEGFEAQSIQGGAFNRIKGALSTFGEYSEVGVRLAVYKKTKGDLMSDFVSRNGRQPNAEEADQIKTQAAVASREIIDFAQGGSWAKAGENVIPYLNASIQGFRVGAQYIKNNPVNFAIKLAQLSLSVGIIMFYNALVADDDDWEKISDGEKMRNFIIFTPMKDKKGNRYYLKIAKTQQAMPFTTLAEIGAGKMLNQVLNQDDDKGLGGKYMMYGDKEYTAMKDAVLSFLPKNPAEWTKEIKSAVPILNAVNAIDNYDNFFNTKVSYDYEKVESRYEDVLDPNTPYFYKALSQSLYPVVGIGPKRLATAVEKVTTGPETSVIIAGAYFLLDKVASKVADVKTDDLNIGEVPTQNSELKAISSMFSPLKSVLKTTNPNLKKYQYEDQLNEIALRSSARIETIKSASRNLGEKYYDAVNGKGGLTREEVIAEFNDYRDMLIKKGVPLSQVEIFANSFKMSARSNPRENWDAGYYDIMYSPTSNATAEMIGKLKGKNLTDEQLKDYIKKYRMNTGYNIKNVGEVYELYRQQRDAK